MADTDAGLLGSRKLCLLNTCRRRFEAEMQTASTCVSITNLSEEICVVSPLCSYSFLQPFIMYCSVLPQPPPPFPIAVLSGRYEVNVIYERQRDSWFCLNMITSRFCRARLQMCARVS